MVVCKNVVNFRSSLLVNFSFMIDNENLELENSKLESGNVKDEKI